MTFQLSKQSRGHKLTVYHVLDGEGSIVGCVNVKNEEAADLEKHWVARAPAPSSAAPADKQNPMVSAMVAAAGRNKFSKQAILRG